MHGSALHQQQPEPRPDPIAILLAHYKPVRLTRRRKGGWSGPAQCEFLEALAQGASIVNAAATVGLSERSAYKLRGHPLGAPFAAAWDDALDIAEATRRARFRFRYGAPDVS